jgi:hypothetical protein
MDSRLEKLKESVESAVEGMSSEQLSWHPPGNWCAAEVLEHLYLSYAGTINGFESVIRSGKPLATRSSMVQRVLTLVVVGLGHMPAGRKTPAVAQPRDCNKPRATAAWACGRWLGSMAGWAGGARPCRSCVQSKRMARLVVTSSRSQLFIPR